MASDRRRRQHTSPRPVAQKFSPALFRARLRLQALPSRGAAGEGCEGHARDKTVACVTAASKSIGVGACTRASFPYRESILRAGDTFAPSIGSITSRSEEHTSELQSPCNL